LGTECKAEGVSIIIPVYNEEGGIASLIERILSEMGRTGMPFELLVVDDGSTDRTRERIDPYAEKVRVLRHEENRGYGAALKTGIHAARFPITLIIDADGTYPTEEIPRLLNELREGTEMVVGARTGPDVRIPLVLSGRSRTSIPACVRSGGRPRYGISTSSPTGSPSRRRSRWPFSQRGLASVLSRSITTRGSGGQRLGLPTRSAF